MLVLFTDGLTEARLPDGQQLWDGHLGALLDATSPTGSSYEAVKGIYDRLRAGSAVLSDDVVLAVLTFRPT